MGQYHLLYTSSSSLLLLVFLFSSVLITCSHFHFGNSKQVSHSSNVTCPESEKRALLQFKHELIDESNRLSSWIEGRDCCSWEGVGCHETSGSVLKLDLRCPAGTYDCKYYLGGQLSPSLVNLTNLRYLDLSFNNFSGIRAPTFLGLLKNLRYLNLSYAEFGGEIPRSLGNLSHMQYLDLGGWNLLSSQDLRWVAGLSSLKVLVLSGVNLSAAEDVLQRINMLPRLTKLDLYGSQLSIIPHLAPLNLTSLYSLDLGLTIFSNHMIPPWLSNLTALHDLRLSYNNLSDPNIPSLLEKMTSLVHLKLSDNRFDISVLKSLCNFSSLSYLDLGDNELQGSIPSEIGQLHKLTNLLLYGNMLNCSVPTNIWQLSRLQELDIGGNSVSGVLSEHHFAKLTELKALDLSENLLSLNVSSSWVPPFHQIQLIRMSSTKVGPRFPTWLRTLKGLQYLDMQNASISDAIPSWFQVFFSEIVILDLSYNHLTAGDPLPMTRMKYGDDESNNLNGSLKAFPSDIFALDLSHNFITGQLPLPTDAGQTVASIGILRLNDNRFAGRLPEDVCKLKNLVELDLSNNFLSGRVPLCIGNLQNLESLYLANNSLCGQIPSSLGNLGFLTTLQLSGNKLTGKLPSSMQLLGGLRILDLGDNGLNDIIPAWIGESFPNLWFLGFQSNNFHGGISKRLCLLSGLQVLNLAHNNLTGSIPHCFNNFSMRASNLSKEFTRYSYDGTFKIYKGGKELEYRWVSLLSVKSISLSTNNLVGEIPNGIMDLVGLQFLNLSNNHLSGTIPEKIGNLKHLETLDFSRNDLHGAIPPSLSGIYMLSFLNLSHNNLSGPIPTGNQLQTLNDPSIYEGNSGLCGKPLPNACNQREHELPKGNGPIEDDDDGGIDWAWFYAGLGPGFSVGVLGIWGILVLKKSWRYACFWFIENACDRVSIIIALKTTRLRRNFH